MMFDLLKNIFVPGQPVSVLKILLSSVSDSF